jgi:hypothetical protein
MAARATWAPARGVPPRERVEAVLHAGPKQRVPGGMELHLVDAFPVPVVRPQDRRMGVRQASPFLGLTAGEQPDATNPILRPAGPLAAHGFHQRSVGPVDVVALERWRLVVGAHVLSEPPRSGPGNPKRERAGNFCPGAGVILEAMTRERWATTAFAVLSAVALVAVILLRSPTGGATAAQADPPAVGKPTPSPTSPPTPGPIDSPTPSPTGGTPELRNPGPCERTVPLFSGRYLMWSRPVSPQLVRALARLDAFPEVTRRQTLRYPGSEWVGSGRRHIFSFYDRRMAGIDFGRMNPHLRELIGVRPRGEIDSPPLLYVSRKAAVLLQFRRDLGALVSLFC